MFLSTPKSKGVLAFKTSYITLTMNTGKNFQEGTILYRTDTNTYGIIVTLEKAIAYLIRKGIPQSTITELERRRKKLPGTYLIYLPGSELYGTVKTIPFNYIPGSLPGYSQVSRSFLGERKGVPIRELAERETLGKFLEFLEQQQ